MEELTIKCGFFHVRMQWVNHWMMDLLATEFGPWGEKATEFVM